MLALVAEDSRTQAYQLKALLESEGFEVVVAVDREPAFAQFLERLAGARECDPGYGHDDQDRQQEDDAKL